MAWEQVLSPEVMQRLAARPGGSGWSDETSRPITIGGRAYQAAFRPSGSYGMDASPGNELESVFSYDPNKTRAGQDRFGVYNPDGTFLNEGTFKTDDAGKMLALALAAAGGMQFLPGGAFGGAAGGAGYGALGATEPVASIGTLGGLTEAELAAMASGGASTAAGGAGYGTLGAVEPAASIGATGGSGAAGAAGATGAAGTVGNALSTVAPYIGPAASVIGGVVAGNAAQDAAETQAQSAREAQDIQERMFNKVVELNEPFRQGGLNALERLQIGIGLKDGEGKGDLTRDFTAADFQADPGYQYRLDEGQKALDRFAASRGRFNAGRTAKDTMRFQQGEASQEYGRAFDRFGANQIKKLNPLQSLTGVAQTSANTVGGAAQNYGNNAANLITGAGNATAAGQVGRMNAITGGISQGISQYQTNALLDRLLERGRY